MATSKWAAALEAGGKIAAEFEALLRQRLEEDWEVDDELVNETLAAMRRASTKQQLIEEMSEMYEDGTADMCDW